MVPVIAEERGVAVLIDRKRKGLIDYSSNCHLIVGGNKKVGSQDGVVANNGGKWRVELLQVGVSFCFYSLFLVCGVCSDYRIYLYSERSHLRGHCRKKQSK